jgi:hypothetical protein
MRARHLGFALCIGLAACGGGDETDTPATFDPADFTSGNFRFYTHAVQDRCLGGALNVLFMPEGPATPRRFQNPIPLYNGRELPRTYEVQLQEPFHAMDVTLTAGANPRAMRVRGAQNPGVLLNEDAYGDCTGDLTIDVDLTLIDNDNVNGTADISMSNLVGAQGRCPVLDQDPCHIALTLQARREP